MSVFLRELLRECSKPKFWKLFVSYVAALFLLGYLFPRMFNFLAEEGYRTQDKHLTEIANFMTYMAYAFTASIGLVPIYHCYIVVHRVRMRCKIIRGLTSTRTFTRRISLERRPQIQHPPQPLQQQISTESQGARTQSTMLSSRSQTLSSGSHSEGESSAIQSPSAAQLGPYVLRIEPQTEPSTPKRRSMRILGRTLSQSSQTTPL